MPTGMKLRVDYYLSPYIMVPGNEVGIAVDSTQLVHIWREYVGNCIYENDTLRMVLIDGGYITFDGASHQPLYHYYAKDYLGNNRAVTDEAGRIEEINHYYPFGGLMGDSWATATQPYKYIGKELDRTHGLDWYDHGARHYDPVTGRWNVADAMAEKYYSLSPYASCGDDPVNTIDENGMDWYTDIDKTFQYNPQVHSQKDLSKGQVYRGAYFTTGKGNSQVTYRRDGSILYANETKAYNRIWNQASVHYRRMGEKGGREVAAFILADGRVLVLPDYKNDNTTSRMDVANYRLTRRTLSNGKENFLTIGQVHTHQDRSYPATPSYYTLDGYGDLGYSKDHASLPVFTLGHDGQVHGIRGCTNSNGQVIGLIASIRKNEKSRQSLLNGRTSLYSLIKRLPTIKR